jgi:molybdopterin/thiamine biosynthesis adenylyltransferase
MSTLKFTDTDHWALISEHFAHAVGERFAFGFTRTLHDGATGPVLEVVDISLIADEDVEHDDSGWYIGNTALDRVHNQAIALSTGLAEFHNHGVGPPRFSRTDEVSLAPMASYAVELLAGHPYVAAVWAAGGIHAEWWGNKNDEGIVRGRFDTVTVIGDQLRVLNASIVREERYARQLPLLSDEGQAAVAAMRVAVVGAGGTGSQALMNLAYLGFRNLLVLDDDKVETTNLNRLVTAEPVDLGIAKTTAARRRVRAIDPRIDVTPMPGIAIDGGCQELNDVDLIIGCVDNDGPRQRLNKIAVDTRTPYLDIATGVDDTGLPLVVGGRVIFILPGDACLSCLNELDPAEVSRWAKSPDQQRLDREHGYGTDSANPSVVHLNALAVGAAMSEVIAWISGARAPARWLDIDLTGSATNPGTQIGPLQLPSRDYGCITCGAVTPASDNQHDGPTDRSGT